MKALQRFIRQVWLERAARGLLVFGCCLLAGACLCLGLYLLGVSWYREAGLTWLLCSLAALGGWLARRPTQRQAAARADAMGLEERAVTMVQYAGENAFMAQLQRLDAEEKITALPMGKPLPLLSRRLWAICLALLVLTVVLSLAAQARWAERATEDQRMLDGFLQDLEESIRASSLSEEEKKRLLEQLSRLGDAPETLEEQLQRMVELDELREEFLDAQLLESAPDSLAALLLRYPALRELGRAILQGTRPALEGAFERLDRTLFTRQETLNRPAAGELLESLDFVRRSMELQAFDPLDLSVWRLLQGLGQGLENALAAQPGEDAQTARDILDITRVLMLQLLVGDGAEPTPQEEEEAPYNNHAESGRTGAGDEESGEKSVVGLRVTGGSGGSGQGGGKRPQRPMTEKIYDPERAASQGASETGQDPEEALVPYGEVYGLYYADYLEETLPEDIRETVAAYFDGL